MSTKRRGFTTAVVVPCYNEADRISTSAFEEFVDANPHIWFVFVNDGSSDRTQEVLENFCRNQERCEVLTLSANQGKGEAIRVGINYCIERGKGEVIGYWDADLATPLSAINDFLDVFATHPRLVMVVGSRVKLMGRDIKRKMVRHYVGRVFATLASTILGLAVYDTQCGAKLFRTDHQLKQLFAAPFLSRWVFDVEIFARLKKFYSEPAEKLVFEYPLWKWQDVAGSKLKGRDFVIAAKDLLRIWQYY